MKLSEFAKDKKGFEKAKADNIINRLMEEYAPGVVPPMLGADLYQDYIKNK